MEVDGKEGGSEAMAGYVRSVGAMHFSAQSQLINSLMCQLDVNRCIPLRPNA